MIYDKLGSTTHIPMLIAGVWAQFAAAAVQDFRYDGGGANQLDCITREASTIADGLTAEFRKRFLEKD